MMITSSKDPFSLIHLNTDRYLALLPEKKDRSLFISSNQVKFEELGLVLYPWSPAIDASPISYRYKVLVDLIDVPIQAWNAQHLLPMISKFGLLLEHTKFEGVKSLEKLRVLVAVRRLEEIPLSAHLIDRFLLKPIPLQVVSWIDEPFTVTAPIDPTPSSSYFREVDRRIRNIPPISKEKISAVPLGNTVSVEFEQAYLAWLSLPPSSHKSDFQRSLQKSPYWEIMQRASTIEANPGPTVPLSSLHSASQNNSLGTGFILHDTQTQSNPSAPATKDPMPSYFFENSNRKGKEPAAASVTLPSQPSVVPKDPPLLSYYRDRIRREAFSVKVGDHSVQINHTSSSKSGSLSQISSATTTSPTEPSSKVQQSPSLNQISNFSQPITIQSTIRNIPFVSDPIPTSTRPNPTHSHSHSRSQPKTKTTLNPPTLTFPNPNGNTHPTHSDPSPQIDSMEVEPLTPFLPSSNSPPTPPPPMKEGFLSPPSNPLAIVPFVTSSPSSPVNPCYPLIPRLSDSTEPNNNSALFLHTAASQQKTDGSAPVTSPLLLQHFETLLDSGSSPPLVQHSLLQPSEEPSPSPSPQVSNAVFQRPLETLPPRFISPSDRRNPRSAKKKTFSC